MYYALSFTSIVAPIIIGAQLAIPFGLILSLIFLKEEISLFKWTLIFIAFAGIVVIAYDPNFINERIALIFCILMAFFYALANMMARRLKDIDTSVLNGWCNFLAFFPLIITSFIFDGNPIIIISNLNNSTFLVILHASLIVSVIGHAGMFYLYRFYSVATVLPFYSLFPIFGIVLTYLMFKEILTIQQFIGSVLVIGSVYLIHRENKKETGV
jgi:O-acetylserine/cysteine efflux transporter